MSNQFAVAASLIHGRLGVREFMGYGDPEVVNLAQRVEVMIDPVCDTAYPDKKRAKVSVELTDGSVVREEQNDVRPLEEGEVWENLQREARELLGQDKAKEFVQKLRSVEELRDVSEISEML